MENAAAHSALVLQMLSKLFLIEQLDNDSGKVSKARLRSKLKNAYSLNTYMLV